MALQSTPFRWGALARLLHWAMVLGLGYAVGLGLWMTDLPVGIQKIKAYALHKSVGVTLLGIAVVRLLWRLLDDRPLPPAGTPRWQRRAAGLTHVLLYSAMLLIPLSGWLYNSAAGFPLRWFKVGNLPRLAQPDPALKSLTHDLHVYAAWTLVGLVVLHAAAALKHHFVDRDDTLNAMLGRQPPVRREDPPS